MEIIGDWTGFYYLYLCVLKHNFMLSILMLNVFKKRGNATLYRRLVNISSDDDDNLQFLIIIFYLIFTTLTFLHQPLKLNNTSNRTNLTRHRTEKYILLTSYGHENDSYKIEKVKLKRIQIKCSKTKASEHKKPTNTT